MVQDWGLVMIPAFLHTMTVVEGARNDSHLHPQSALVYSQNQRWEMVATTSGKE